MPIDPSVTGTSSTNRLSIGGHRKSMPSRPPSKLERLTQRMASSKLGLYLRYLKGGNTPTHRHLTSGADKRVYLPKTSLPGSKIAYYAPVIKLGGVVNKTKTLRQEVAKMRDMKEAIMKMGGSVDRLALEATELTGGDRISGRYTLVVEAAKSDYEDHLISEGFDEEQRITLGGQYLEGISQLNRAGYGSGDQKPENCLIYEGTDGAHHLKISDFGKAESVEGDQSRTYKGNLRFAPPEGTLSTKGDSWGAALVLIRTFEEMIPDANGEPLTPIPTNKRDEPSTRGRRGVEKFIVEHKDFLGLDEPSLTDKLFRRLPRQAKLTKLSTARKIRQQEAVHGYIDAMISSLKGREGTTPGRESKLDALGQLLKDMTNQDPNIRITTTEANTRYEAIFSPEEET